MDVEEIKDAKHILNGRRFKSVLFTIFLSIIGYFLFTLWGGWNNVVEAVTSVGVFGIGLALVLSLINFGLRFLRWLFFLATLGYRIPFLSGWRIYMSGFSLTTTPGKTGEAIRGVFVKDYGVPFRKSLGVFFSERLSDLISVSLLASTGLWIYPQARPVLLVVALVYGFLLLAVQKDSWIRFFEAFARRRLPERFAHGIEFCLEMIFAFRACFRGKALLVSLTLGVIAWISEALALYYFLYVLGYHVSLLTAIFIYGFSLVIGGITLLPGGLGGAEFTMLQLLMLNDVPASAAVAVTLVVRLTTLWFSVFLGFLSLPKNLFIKE